MTSIGSTSARKVKLLELQKFAAKIQLEVHKMRMRLKDMQESNQLIPSEDLAHLSNVVFLHLNNLGPDSV